MTYTYSFACPFCGGSWQFEQFASIAAEVFSGWDGIGACPLCKGTFSWVKPGTLKGARWYDGKKHYKPGRCAGCGKAIDGRRKHCNVACRQRAYRKRKVLRRGA